MTKMWWSVWEYEISSDFISIFGREPDFSDDLPAKFLPEYKIFIFAPREAQNNDKVMSWC